MKIFRAIAGTGRYITHHPPSHSISIHSITETLLMIVPVSSGTNVFLPFPLSPLSVNVSHCHPESWTLMKCQIEKMMIVVCPDW